MGMEELPKESWFYSQEGERLGPVSLEELRAVARSGRLDPRHDLVWVQGMEDWRPSGEVAGLFERAGGVVPEEAYPGSPYAAPRQDHAAARIARGEGWPGACRPLYFVGAIVFPFLWGGLFGFFEPQLRESLEGGLEQWVVWGAMLVPVIVSVVITLKRLENLGMSRWWFFGDFVPLLNFWVGYRCFACPAGYAQHKKLDTPGIVLAVLYWLLIVVALLVVIAFVAVTTGAVGGPELQETLHQMLEEAGVAIP
jgi:uncharacterized membrane protein YhaH (DUF805 family)